MTSKITVLVIVTDRGLLELVKEALEMEDFEVLQAKNENDALGILASGKKPDLVFLDTEHSLKHTSEFIELLRNDAALKQVPVIVSSGLVYRNEIGPDVSYIRAPDLDVILMISSEYCARVPA